MGFKRSMLDQKKYLDALRDYPMGICCLLVATNSAFTKVTIVGRSLASCFGHIARETSGNMCGSRATPTRRPVHRSHRRRRSVGRRCATRLFRIGCWSRPIKNKTPSLLLRVGCHHCSHHKTVCAKPLDGDKKTNDDKKNAPVQSGCCLNVVSRFFKKFWAGAARRVPTVLLAPHSLRSGVPMPCRTMPCCGAYF